MTDNRQISVFSNAYLCKLMFQLLRLSNYYSYIIFE